MSQDYIDKLEKENTRLEVEFNKLHSGVNFLLDFVTMSIMEHGKVKETDIEAPDYDIDLKIKYKVDKDHPQYKYIKNMVETMKKHPSLKHNVRYL